MPLVIEASLGTTFGPDAWPDTGLRIVRLARERWGRGAVSPGRRPPWSTLGYVMRGCLRLHRLRREFSAGTLFYSAPEDYRRMEAVGGPLELVLCAYHDGRDDLLPAPLREHQWMRVADRRVVAARCSELIEEARPGDALAHAACVHRLHLVLLAAGRDAAVDEDDRRARAHFVTARQLFDEGWDRIDSVDTVARHCGISHTYLCRLFKRYAGCTPLQYWTRRRIRIAAERLWQSEVDLATVAEEVGFADQFAFSKAFKRLMGASPSTYQAQVRREG